MRTALTLLAVFSGRFFLLHPRVLGHVEAAAGRRQVGRVAGRRMLRAQLARAQLRQRRHELGHGGLAVDEAGLGAGLEHGVRRACGRHGGQPEPVAAVLHAVRRRPHGRRAAALHRELLLHLIAHPHADSHGLASEGELFAFYLAHERVTVERQCGGVAYLLHRCRCRSARPPTNA